MLTNFNEENPPIPQKKGLRWQIEIFFKTLKENLKIKVLSLTQERFGNTPTYRALGPNECAACTLFNGVRNPAHDAPQREQVKTGMRWKC